MKTEAVRLKIVKFIDAEVVNAKGAYADKATVLRMLKEDIEDCLALLYDEPAVVG